MADPAWGTLSMSDEEMARALCSFQHSRSPPSLQPRPVPFHDPETSLYRHHQELPQLAPRLTPGAHEGADPAGFGRPLNAVYSSSMPVNGGQNDAPSPFAGGKMPTTSSGDWLDQLQQQQQRSSSFVQAPWNGEKFAPSAMSVEGKSFSSSDRSQARPQPNVMPRSSAGGRDNMLTMIRETTLPSALQARDLISGYGAILKPQHLHHWSSNCQGSHTHDSQSVVTGISRSWEIDTMVPFTQMSMTRAAPYVHESTSKFTQSPQQAYAPSANECSRTQKAASANLFVPNHDGLDVMNCHYSSTRDVSDIVVMKSDEFGIKERHNESLLSPAQTRAQASMFAQVQIPAQVQAQMQVEAQTRPPIPPTGVVVVPGMSLAASTRLLTMRDLLNCDDAPVNNAVRPWRKRSNGSKEPRLPSKRKAPRKKSPLKFQKVPQQQNAQRFNHSSTNMQAKEVLSSSITSLAPAASISSSKTNDHIYLPFAGLEATREMQQVVGFTSTRPVFPPAAVFAQPRLSVSKPATFGNRAFSTLSTHVRVNNVDPSKKKRPYKAKKKLYTHLDEDKQLVSKQTDYQQPLTTSTIVPRQAAVSDRVAPVAERTLFMIATKLRCSSGDQPSNLGQTNAMASVETNDEAGHDREQVSTEEIIVKQLPESLAQRSSELVWNGSLSPTDVAPSTKSRRRAKVKLPCLKSQVLNATAVKTSDSHSSPVVNNHTHLANKTVVIFCKRDFMRYQAAKIWRKYQEQLTKQEEWREVRVAGKRTRYLNSRYDDEVRRNHTRATHKQNEKRRKRTTQKVEDLGHVASSTAVTSNCSPITNNLANSQIRTLSLATDAGSSGVDVPNEKKYTSGATSPTVIQTETTFNDASPGECKGKSAVTLSVDLDAVRLNGTISHPATSDEVCVTNLNSTDEETKPRKKEITALMISKVFASGVLSKEESSVMGSFTDGKSIPLANHTVEPVTPSATTNNLQSNEEAGTYTNAFVSDNCSSSEIVRTIATLSGATNKVSIEANKNTGTATYSTPDMGKNERATSAISNASGMLCGVGRSDAADGKYISKEGVAKTASSVPNDVLSDEVADSVSDAPVDKKLRSKETQITLPATPDETLSKGENCGNGILSVDKVPDSEVNEIVPFTVSSTRFLRNEDVSNITAENGNPSVKEAKECTTRNGVAPNWGIDMRAGSIAAKSSPANGGEVSKNPSTEENRAHGSHECVVLLPPTPSIAIVEAMELCANSHAESDAAEEVVNMPTVSIPRSDAITESMGVFSDSIAEDEVVTEAVGVCTDFATSGASAKDVPTTTGAANI